MVWSTGRSRTSTTDHKRWRLAVLRRDKFRCQLNLPGCQGAATEADHIIPVSRGGSPTALDNGQAVCAACHTRKTREEWRLAQQSRTRYRKPYQHPALTQDVLADLAAMKGKHREG